jgi:hypothetical protein
MGDPIPLPAAAAAAATLLLLKGTGSRNGSDWKGRSSMNPGK